MSEIGDDLLWGGKAIEFELLKDDSKPAVRKIYHLHQQRQIPTFRLGNEIVCRRSTLRQHIADVERSAVGQEA